MDERLEKAFQTANYLNTLGNQKKIALEKFNQSLIYYSNGGAFTANQELISFIKVLIDTKNKSAVIIDDNRIPVEINNLELFLESIISTYTEATNEYIKTYSSLKTKRRVEDLVAL